MGKYYLNGIDLLYYGFIPGHASNSNIALSGAWSLPSRFGECYHDWPDEIGVEPYVDLSDIRFAGRDLELYGTVSADCREQFTMNVNELFSALHQFTDLVELSCDFGRYNVYIKDVVNVGYVGNGYGTVIFKFREPIVDISGFLPSGTLMVGDRIDGMTFKSLGLTVLKFTNVDDRPGTKAQNFTAYRHEGYQVTKTKVRTVELEMLIEAKNYNEFMSQIRQYYQLLGGAGGRDITIHGETESYFAINGFTVSDVVIGDSVTAILKIKLLDGYILNEHVLCDDDTLITIGDDDELIIAYYG